MEKTIELEELYASDAYKNSGKTFPHPKEFISQVHDIITNGLKNATWTLKVDKEGGAKLEEGEDIKTYGRGLLQYNSPSGNEESSFTIGIIWSYDTSRWAVKVFTGANVSACTNYLVFGAEDIYERNFRKTKGANDREKDLLWKHESQLVTESVFGAIEEFIKDRINIVNRTNEFMQGLHHTIFNAKGESGNEIDELIGRLYTGDVVCGEFEYNTFSEACRLIFNDNYYHPNKQLYQLKDEELSLWTLYQALTQRFTDGGVIPIDMIPTKTLEVTNLLRKEIK